MTIEILDEPKKYHYYVTWVDQGRFMVFGSYFVSFQNPIQTEDDVNGLKVIAGAKDANDNHIVILDWKRLS